MTALLILLLIGVLLWLFGPRLMAWGVKSLLRHHISRMQGGPSRTYYTSGAQRSTRRPSGEKKKNSRKKKLTVQEIEQKKFSKDQGEYVDFHEEKL